MILSTEGLGHPQVCQRIVQFTKDLLLLDEPKAQRAAAVLSRLELQSFRPSRRLSWPPLASSSLLLIAAAPHCRRSSSLPLLASSSPLRVVAAPRRGFVVAAPRPAPRPTPRRREALRRV